MNKASSGSTNKHGQATFGSWRKTNGKKINHPLPPHPSKKKKAANQRGRQGWRALKPHEESAAAAFHLRLSAPLAGLSGREKHKFSPNSASVGSLELQTYLINSILPNREIPVS